MKSKKYKKIYYEFSYLQRNNDLYTPTATIQIKSFKTQKEEEYNAIIDTGSEITLISEEIIKQFDFSSISSEKKVQTATSEKGITVVPYWVRIRFKHLNKKDNLYYPIKIYCCSKKNLNQDILLGMDFIKNFEITFSGKNKKLLIIEEAK